MERNFLGNLYKLHMTILSLTSVMMMDTLEMKYEHKSMRKLRNNFHWIVLLGNEELAKYLAEWMFKEDGYGFNKFHHLAIVVESVGEIADLKRMSVGKKSITDQVAPIHCAVLNKNPEIF